MVAMQSQRHVPIEPPWWREMPRPDLRGHHLAVHTLRVVGGVSPGPLDEGREGFVDEARHNANVCRVTGAQPTGV